MPKNTGRSQSTISTLKATIARNTRSSGVFCISSVLDAHPFHHFDSTMISATESDAIKPIVANMPPTAICSIAGVFCRLASAVAVNTPSPRFRFCGVWILLWVLLYLVSYSLPRFV